MSPELLLGLRLLSLVAGPLPEPAEPLPPLTAVVTRVEGRVLAEAGDGRRVELRPGRVLPGDWRISVPDGGALAVVCSSERRAVLEREPAARSTGRTVDTAARDACAAGEPVLPGTYRALARGDRDLALERSREVRLLLVRTRGSEEDDPRIPVLLAPRETAVTEARPEIRWTGVPEADEYVLELTGPTSWAARLPAGEVPCRPEARLPGEMEVCSVPWPADAPDLEPPSSHFLSVGARTGVGGSVRSGGRSLVRRLPAEATGLGASLSALREMDLPPSEASLRTAVLLAELGLRNAAEAALRQSLLEAPSARAYLLQGSLDLDAGLARAALRSFREALRLARDPVVAAEAEAGIAAARDLLARTP